MPVYARAVATSSSSSLLVIRMVPCLLGTSELTRFDVFFDASLPAPKQRAPNDAGALVAIEDFETACHAATVSRNPKARMTFATVANSGFPFGESAL